MSKHHPQHIDDDASISSEDSREPYFDIRSGRVLTAREAWDILAGEGHPRFRHRVSGGASGGGGTRGASDNPNGPNDNHNDNHNGNGNGKGKRKSSPAIAADFHDDEADDANSGSGRKSQVETLRSRVDTASSDSSAGSISLGAGIVVGNKHGQAVVNFAAKSTAFAVIEEASQHVVAASQFTAAIPPDLRTEDDSIGEVYDGDGESAPSPSSTSSGGDMPGGGPTQSSIDRALHPTNVRIGSSYYSSASDPLLPHPELRHNDDNDDDDDDETDPIVLRAKAMALAAKNGAKLTPEQMQLIARPDVQQQKLIEEARRKGQTMHSSHHGNALGMSAAALGGNLERIGADFKKFIETEKEKPPLQWGADLGKFIEVQTTSLKLSVAGGGNDAGGVGDAKTEAAGPPHLKKKMEGFGTDPFAEDHPTPPSKAPKKSLLDGMLVLPGTSKKVVSEPNSPSTTTQQRKALGEGGDTPAVTPYAPGKPSIFGSMPQLPALSTGAIAGMLPGVGGGGGGGEKDATPPQNEPLRLSGVLWKRRSGMGKHSSKAWERRRVELRGTKIMYYKTLEEEREESGAAASRDPAENVVVVDGTPRDSNAPDTNAGPPDITESIPPPPMTSSKSRYSIFEQAAQAAEQRFQSAKDEISRMAVAAGIEKSSSVDIPRGVLDLCKEKATVAASMGHSGSPTPFCISIKVKSETKWKFCFDGHSAQMEWLAAMTDAVVQASVDANKSGGTWATEDYCIRRVVDENAEGDSGVVDVENREIIPVSREVSDIPAEANSAAVQYASDIQADSNAADTVVETLVDDEKEWMIAGLNLNIAWAALNIALIFARARSTSIDQYWMMVVFLNVGLWQLCSRPKILKRQAVDRPLVQQSLLVPGTSPSVQQGPNDTAANARIDYIDFKPPAGNSTLKVSSPDDSSFTEDGFQFPTWLPVSSDMLDVRSHGYLTTKKKIPSPGELYECIAVDCFASSTRFADIATRVVLPDINFDDGNAPKTWKCPDIFVVSIAIPTEAPKFGRSTDDGPGTTFVGYFKMKEETRATLRRITAPGYDPSTDTTDSDKHVQKRLANGVRLWEEWCTRSLVDPTFQARFKLIPQANLTELGCPSYIEKYNGKPVLIKRNQVTGFLSDYPSLNTMEFDISLHPFPFLFKQAMAYLKENYFDKGVATFGFVIEGRNDEELPEVVIGAMRVCRPSPKYIVKGEDFFAGKCPKSSLR